MTLLTLRGMYKSFDGKTVLQLRELSLAEGEIVWLGGGNGAGKTTLLRLLAGLDTPDSCSYFSFADALKTTAPTVVYLHQSPHMLATSVRANVEYGLRRCGMPLKRAAEAMEWAGVAHLATAAAVRLSDGEKRRVALARVRALRPRLYLLDEPTAHLDDDGATRVLNLITTLKTEKATAIISSHDRHLPATVRWTLKDGDITVLPAN